MHRDISHVTESCDQISTRLSLFKKLFCSKIKHLEQNWLIKLTTCFNPAYFGAIIAQCIHMHHIICLILSSKLSGDQGSSERRRPRRPGSLSPPFPSRIIPRIILDQVSGCKCLGIELSKYIHWFKSNDKNNAVSWKTQTRNACLLLIPVVKNSQHFYELETCLCFCHGLHPGWSIF